MSSFEDFLRKIVSGEADYTVMVEKAAELKESLISFTPKDVEETTWDMAVIEYVAWLNLQPYVKADINAWTKLVLYLKSAVFAAYWLGRRDESLEGMLEEVKLDSD